MKLLIICLLIGLNPPLNPLCYNNQRVIGNNKLKIAYSYNQAKLIRQKVFIKFKKK